MAQYSRAPVGGVSTLQAAERWDEAGQMDTHPTAEVPGGVARDATNPTRADSRRRAYNVCLDLLVISSAALFWKILLVSHSMAFLRVTKQHTALLHHCHENGIVIGPIAGRVIGEG